MKRPSEVSVPGRPDHPLGRSDRPDRAHVAGPDVDQSTSVCTVTREGAAWLVSAGTYPPSTLARWTSCPTAPLVLPCGVTFDVVNAPIHFGRWMLDALRKDGPGSGPVAVHRGRMLLFAAPGAAQRLRSLLTWQTWGTSAEGDQGTVPSLLCHGSGDAVTVPPLAHPVTGQGTENCTARWLVAPAVRDPWLPGPEALLWACGRAVRAASRPQEDGWRGRAPGGRDTDFSFRRSGC